MHTKWQCRSSVRKL